jgi:hypothetical protein
VALRRERHGHHGDRLDRVGMSCGGVCCHCAPGRGCPCDRVGWQKAI